MTSYSYDYNNPHASIFVLRLRYEFMIASSKPSTYLLFEHDEAFSILFETPNDAEAANPRIIEALRPLGSQWPARESRLSTRLEDTLDIPGASFVLQILMDELESIFPDLSVAGDIIMPHSRRCSDSIVETLTHLGIIRVNDAFNAPTQERLARTFDKLLSLQEAMDLHQDTLKPDKTSPIIRSSL